MTRKNKLQVKIKHLYIYNAIVIYILETKANSNIKHGNVMSLVGLCWLD